ncbi:MAG: redoxin domain-containing protein [Myxococcales bacterium]|nr:redoxin domain-containing protein [Myxococcales bacterium]
MRSVPHILGMGLALLAAGALGCESTPPGPAAATGTGAATGTTGAQGNTGSQFAASKVGASSLQAAAQLTAAGGLVSTLDGGEVKVDFEKMKAGVSMRHRLNADPTGKACVPEVAITVAKEDGSCKLELEFRAGFEGEGLLLDKARFHASVGERQDGVVINTIKCKEWTQTSGIKGEIIYEKIGGEGSLAFAPLTQPNAGKEKATLPKTMLKPEGVLTMKFKGKQFKFDLANLTFSGDAMSIGSKDVACVKQSYDMPKWQFEDINPDSAGAKTTYGMDAFKGKRVIVMMGAGWCASCIAQAKTMQKVRAELIAAGRSDFEVMAINDGSAKAQQAEMTTKAGVKFPVFQGGSWDVHVWDRDGVQKKASKNDAFAYDYNGKPMGFFQGAGTVFMGEFEKFVTDNLNAKAGEGYVDCLVAGSKRSCALVQ